MVLNEYFIYPLILGKASDYPGEVNSQSRDCLFQLGNYSSLLGMFIKGESVQEVDIIHCTSIVINNKVTVYFNLVITHLS